ncbi:MAG: DUF6046 domain-containing protein [Flavobacteriia bacterium]|jgi:hypothetical protein
MNKQFILPKPTTIEGQAKLIAKGYGLGLIKPLFYNVDVDKATKEQANLAKKESLKKSYFGLPVFGNFQILPVSYIDDLGNTINIVDTLDIEIALFEINQSKNIVKTEIAGANTGTVKEYIGLSDYQINIKGCIVDNLADGSFEQQIKLLVDYCEAPIQLNVTGDFLDYFNVKTLVIENYKLSQREGVLNLVDYELSCVSDSPFQLTYTTNTKKVAKAYSGVPKFLG